VRTNSDIDHKTTHAPSYNIPGTLCHVKLAPSVPVFYSYLDVQFIPLTLVQRLWRDLVIIKHFNRSRNSCY